MIAIKVGNGGQTDGPWAWALLPGATEAKAYYRNQLTQLVNAILIDGSVCGVGISYFDLPLLAVEVGATLKHRVTVIDAARVAKRVTGKAMSAHDIATSFGVTSLQGLEEALFAVAAVQQHGLRVDGTDHPMLESDIIPAKEV